MFDEKFWTAAACLAGFGWAWYLNNSKQSSTDPKLVTVAYEVHDLFAAFQMMGFNPRMAG